MKHTLLKICCLFGVLALTACQQIGPSEVGVRFRSLPSDLGPFSFGGSTADIVEPGQLAVLMPWESLYRFNTGLQDVSWPSAKDQANHKEAYVHTRALDGNEVALGVTVRYRVMVDRQRLLVLVQHVAVDDAGVRGLVTSIARADIRTYMNGLRTAQFLDEQSRFHALDQVRASMQKRLNPYGIEIEAVILDDFRFERLLKDGSVDASYQEKITQIQKLREDTERFKSRIDTERAKKQEVFNNEQAAVNRQVAEAEGYKQQAKLRGDGYFSVKSNDAKGILATGKAEVQGLKEQIDALSGPGADALLKLQIAKSILAGNPKFVILNQGKNGGGLSLERLDTNQLLTQLGLIESQK